MESIWLVLAKGSMAVLMTFLIFWVISLFIKNPSIIDVCWGTGFIVMAYIFIVNGAGWTTRNIFMFGLVAIWGIRISYFVLKRLNFGKIEDHRYTNIREKWKPYIRFNFLVFFVFQALIEIFISLSLLYIAVNTADGLNLIEMLGIALCLTAIIAEAVADEQLERFKKDLNNKGKVCEIGLWNYSRHPNYFFEFAVWASFFIFALGSPYGWIAFISPLIVLHLVLNVSGIPLAEKLSLERRGEPYKKYQETTSAFVPLPKRKI